MKKRAFTIVELLIAVIIIGILTTLAIPQYSKAVEKSKAAKAKYALSLIRQAEELYFDNYDAYTATGTLDTLISKLNPYIELSQLINDSDWTYEVSSATTNPNCLDLLARRTTGAYATMAFGQTCDLNYWVDGATDGQWPPPPLPPPPPPPP